MPCSTPSPHGLRPTCALSRSTVCFPSSHLHSFSSSAHNKHANKQADTAYAPGDAEEIYQAALAVVQAPSAQVVQVRLPRGLFRSAQQAALAQASSTKRAALLRPLTCFVSGVDDPASPVSLLASAQHLLKVIAHHAWRHYITFGEQPPIL